MQNKKIQFTFSQHINSKAITAWEQHIFEETYNEFLIQSAVFQPVHAKVDSFKELLKHNSNAQQLHYLLATRIVPSINLLNHNIYGVIDNLNQNYLQFQDFNVNIIQSDLSNKAKHYIAVNYLSKPYDLVSIFNNYFLVAEETNDKKQNNIVETLMFPFQPNLSISAIHQQKSDLI